MIPSNRTPRTADTPYGPQALAFLQSTCCRMEWIEHVVCGSIGAYSVVLLLSVATQI